MTRHASFRNVIVILGAAMCALSPGRAAAQGTLATDKVVSIDGTGAKTSPAITTTSAELLVAFVSSDGPPSGSQTVTVSGAGLAWTLVRRVNTRAGTSEIWSATAPGALSNATVTSTPSIGGLYQSLTVVTFTNAGGIGASAGASAASGAPTVSLTTTRAASLVFGVGNDWDNAIARTVGSGQTMVHQALAPLGDTLWVQRRTDPVAASGTSVPVNDTAPTTDRWNLAAVEIYPAGPPPVIVPNVVNLTQAAATTAITSAGLVVGNITTASSGTIPAGSVISQVPAAGTAVSPGSAVALVISTGPPPPVLVPDVVNMPQATAVSTITGAGLTVGAIATATSTTVPAGSVISESPAAGTQVPTGSAVDLVVSLGPPSSGITVDTSVFSDGNGTRSVSLTTKASGDVLVAFAASDGPGTGGTQTLTVSGGGLTWTRVARVNAQAGDSEIWTAVAASVLSNASITCSQSRSPFYQSLVVVAFRGAAGTGAVATGNAVTGAASVKLVTTAAGAVVYGVGNDWDLAVSRTPAAGQAIVHQYLAPAGDTMWVQNVINAVPIVGTAVQVGVTAPIDDRWNLAAVEVVPSGPPLLVTVPDVVNQPQASAIAALNAAGLGAGTLTSAQSQVVLSGSIISEAPPAGTTVAAGSLIDLVVSIGTPPLYVVPNVVNQTQAAAVAAIEAAGLGIGTISSAKSASVPAGSVISQSPAAGTSATPGSPVAIVVSRGNSSGVEFPGWYAADMHVHRSCGGTPESISSLHTSMSSENLAAISLLADMGNGEVQTPATDLPRVNGTDDPTSTTGRIVHWDAEWHWDAIYYQYAHQALGGHLIALGLAHAEQMWQEYTYPILKWAHDQGGIAGFAHMQFLDGGIPQSLTCCTPIEYPVEVALGAADFVSEDVEGSDTAMDAYYKLLNTGFRPGFAGGTDHPCDGGNVPGLLLTYAQPAGGNMTYRAWIDALRAGRTVVSRNGHAEFVQMTVNGTATPGDEIGLDQAGSLPVTVEWTASQNLSGTLELVQNGQVIASRAASIAAGGSVTLQATVDFSRSGWVAARRMDSGAGHMVQTGAVFVIVNGAPIRVSSADAQYFVNWIDNLLTRTNAGGAWASYFPTQRTAAQARYKAAKAIFQQIAADAAAAGR